MRLWEGKDMNGVLRISSGGRVCLSWVEVVEVKKTWRNGYQG